jgi:hypothetical protein
MVNDLIRALVGIVLIVPSLVIAGEFTGKVAGVIKRLEAF